MSGRRLVALTLNIRRGRIRLRFLHFQSLAAGFQFVFLFRQFVVFLFQVCLFFRKLPARLL